MYKIEILLSIIETFGRKSKFTIKTFGFLEYLNQNLDYMLLAIFCQKFNTVRVSKLLCAKYNFSLLSFFFCFSYDPTKFMLAR